MTNNFTDIDIENAKSVARTQISTTNSKDFSPEWLSYQIMTKIYKEMTKIDSNWKNATGSLSLYANTIGDIGKTKPPKTHPYGHHSGSGKSSPTSKDLKKSFYNNSIDENINGADLDEIDNLNDLDDVLGDLGDDSEFGNVQVSNDETNESGIEVNNTYNQNANEFLNGSITFSEGIPLFEQLGNESIASSSTSTAYEFIGIEKYDGKYFYKVMDHLNGKNYYAEISDKSKLDSNISQVLEVKKDTVKLDTVNLNSNDVFGEVVGENEMYLVKDIVSAEGDNSIKLAKVINLDDNKESYIQINNNVEVRSIDSLMNR